MSAVVLPTAAVVSLSSCTVTNGPTPMRFGFRAQGDDIVVAAPLCASESVFGAEIRVGVDGAGDGDGFRTLWQASGPRTEAVRRGVFVVGNTRSFGEERTHVEKPLPGGFYVGLVMGTRDRQTEGDAGWVDVPEMRSAKLGDDEYWTYKQGVMTRAQINAQRTCPTGTG